MAQMFGISQSTKAIQQHLPILNGYEFSSWKEIKKFYTHFPKILDDRIVEEKREVDSNLEVLRERAQNLKDQLDNLIQIQKETLITKRDTLIMQVEDAYAQEEPNTHLISKLNKHITKIEKKFEILTQKPFKKEFNNLKKMNKKYRKLNMKYESIINKRLEPYHRAYEVLANNQEIFAGAIGEEAVISVLTKLPDTYHVFNDITLQLLQTVFWSTRQEYVRSAQVDHLVIGPSGVFIIETKNWKPNTFKHTTFLPHLQVARAGFIFTRLTERKFGRLPVYNTVVTLATLPQIQYPGVDQITIRQLTPHILRRTKKLDLKNIEKLVSWVKKA